MWPSGSLPTREQLHGKLFDFLVGALVINSKAYVTNQVDRTKDAQDWKWHEGNQTEVGLLCWMIGYNVDISLERKTAKVIKNYPFDSNKKTSSCIVRRNDTNGAVERYRRYYKGAAERIVDLCDRYIDINGEVKPFDEVSKQHLIQSVESMTRAGYRSIAFCATDIDILEKDESGAMVDPADHDRMVFIGASGIQDPLRPESRQAVLECQRAGIIVRMVTGDHLETAKFIAAECGILTSSDHISMTGAEFRSLIRANNQSELEVIVPKLRVLARSEPHDKEHLVNWLKAHGEVVAATGDGTNDAPALKAADVGIAMAIAGTDVAKAAAKIQVLDDNFASIVEAVKWGRSVYDNIRKFIQFQLTVNLIAMLISLVGAITGQETPLKAVQLLWVNLIMDTMGALALGTEMPTRKLLQRRPYSINASLISPVMWRNILGQFCLQASLLFGLLYRADTIFNGGDGNPLVLNTTEHYTLIFNAFVWMQIFNEVNSRKVNEEMNVFENFFDNSTFTMVILLSAGFQVLMVEVFGDFAKTTGLTWQMWVGSIVIGFMSLPWGVVIRLIPVNYESGRIILDFDKVFAGADLRMNKVNGSGLSPLKLESVMTVAVPSSSSPAAAAAAVIVATSPLSPVRGPVDLTVPVTPAAASVNGQANRDGVQLVDMKMNDGAHLVTIHTIE